MTNKAESEGRTLKVWVFIPTYQVGELVKKTIDRIPKSALSIIDKILIVDNGSTDSTLKWIEESSSALGDNKIMLYKNKQNYSLGGSTIFAFEQALTHEVDYLICLHGDGQAPPEDLPHFLRLIDKGQPDFVLGSRFMSESQTAHYSKLRKLGNHFFIWLQQWVTGIEARDLGSYIAFKMTTVNALPFRKIPSGMSYHPLLILFSQMHLKRKIQLLEFPISWGAVEVSHVNIFTYGLQHLKNLAKLLFSYRNILLPADLKVESKRIF